MPRYYFHIRDHQNLEEDPEGTDLPSVEKAREEAVLAARELLAEKLSRGDLIDGQRFEITNEDGVIVSEVPFRSVLRLE